MEHNHTIFLILLSVIILSVISVNNETFQDKKDPYELPKTKFKERIPVDTDHDVSKEDSDLMLGLTETLNQTTADSEYDTPDVKILSEKN